MRLPDVVAQRGVAEAGLREVLDPFQAARRKVWCRPQARLVLEHLVGNVGHLESEARLLLLPTADREHFAANFPDVRSAPLHHVRRSRKAPTERVVFLVGHLGPRYAVGDPNQVASASASPSRVRSPAQATYPSGRISTAVGAGTAPTTGSSHTPPYLTSIDWTRSAHGVMSKPPDSPKLSSSGRASCRKA